MESLDGLLDVHSKLVPSVSLSEDTLRQAFRTVAAISFLRDLKDNFVHPFNLEVDPSTYNTHYIVVL